MLTLHGNGSSKRRPGMHKLPGRLAIVCVAVQLVLLKTVSAQDVFNLNALEIGNPDSRPVDLSQFAYSGSFPPGEYRLDIYVNNRFQGIYDIIFVRDSNQRIRPQLSPQQLDNWGVMINSIDGLSALPVEQFITDWHTRIPDARAEMDYGQLALNISVPQAYMKRTSRGYVDRRHWDRGVNSAMLSYGLTGSNAWIDNVDDRQDNYFLTLHSGINFGGWRLRNHSTWSHNERIEQQAEPGLERRSGSEWNSINTYLQHDVPRLMGQFTLGDSFSPAEIFDSVSFRGVQLASDDTMLPDSQRGFAPTIRGIAGSNAQITVRQGGAIIYQDYVSPGPFVIDDIYPSASSGDLQVTVLEADGSERTFSQPFSTVPLMQREGRLKYALTAGKYRSYQSMDDDPIFGQATFLYGLPQSITVYGGAQASDYYYSAALGFGFGLGPLGSVSVDATHARTEFEFENFDDETSRGYSYRFQYSKNIATTASTITLAGYRYSTEGFYTFSEAVGANSYGNTEYLRLFGNRRSRFQVSLNQSLMDGQWGMLAVSGYQQDYWNRDGYERNINVSYSNSWRRMNWMLSYNRSEYTSSQYRTNEQLALNINIPLGRRFPYAFANASTTHDLNGRTSNRVGIHGTALEGRNLSYSLAQGYGNQGEGYNGQLGLDYRGTYGRLNSGYNYTSSSRHLNYGVQGAVIAHPHGVTLGQPVPGLVSPIGLVRAPGASGARVQRGAGIKTDRRGYAIVPYLSPYRRTPVMLDTNTLADDVDLQEGVVNVVPTAGALVIADFKTQVGHRLLVTLLRGNQVVPFGTQVKVTSEDGNEISAIAGEDGLVYLSGVPGQGTLSAQWGRLDDETCHTTFELPDFEDSAFVQRLSMNCVGEES